jgi:hypothetical protein
MATAWSSGVLNKFVAPDLTCFTGAAVPDLSGRFPEAPHWLANHFLSSVLRGSFVDGYRQLALGFIRRAYHAFEAYHAARGHTNGYLENLDTSRPSIRRYYDAVAAWENFALQLSMAFDILVKLNGGEKVFEKNDGSQEQRLHTIANQIKHLASCVTSGQCGEADSVPLWLTNAGVHSFGVAITYEEAADIMTSIAELADELQDPKNFFVAAKDAE